MLTFSLIIGVISLLLIWLRQRRKNYQYFAKMGVPGPKPHIILGNMIDIKEQGFFECIQQWSEKYGKTFGYYEGATPILSTADPDLIQHVFIKEFGKFHSRKSMGLTDPYGKKVDLATARGHNWKKVRSVASPAFSAMRMKQMSPIINNVVDRLMEVLDKKANAGEGFDIHKIYQRLSMDVMGNCAFGVDVNSLQDDDDIFLRKFNEFFKNVENNAGILKAVVFLHLLSPYLSTWISKLNLGSPLSDEWFNSVTKKIIDQRKADTETKRSDLIQLMLDCEINENASLSSLEVVLDKEDVSSDDVISTEAPKRPKKTIHTEEIQASTFIFLLAGYETSSTVLGLLAHHLAQVPEVQEKIQKEIDAHFPEECQPDYGSVQKLEYLNWAIQEILRLYPIGMMGVQRHCFEESSFGDLTIEPGTIIHANMSAIHMDPNHWGPEDPKLFIPERFCPERKAKRHPAAYIPFGIGPRNCVGMRFALMEVKIAAARVLKQYRFVPCKETKNPLPLRKNIIRSPTEGVFLKLEERL